MVILLFSDIHAFSFDWQGQMHMAVLFFLMYTWIIPSEKDTVTSEWHKTAEAVEYAVAAVSPFWCFISVLINALIPLVFSYTQKREDKVWRTWLSWQRKMEEMTAINKENKDDNHQQKQWKQWRDEQILDGRNGEGIKAEKVIEEPSGQELSLRWLDPEMSRGEEMDRMKRAHQPWQKKNPHQVFWHFFLPH